MSDEPPRRGPAASAGVPPRDPTATAPRIASEQLFAGAREVQIVHHGSVYRLKQTALHKLILTK